MISPVKVWRNQKMMHTMLGKTGVVLSWTTIHVPPEGFSSYAPYLVAIIQLDDGTCVTVQIADGDGREIHKGMRVEITIRKAQESLNDGIISYALKARII